MGGGNITEEFTLGSPISRKTIATGSLGAASSSAPRTTKQQHLSKLSRTKLLPSLWTMHSAGSISHATRDRLGVPPLVALSGLMPGRARSWNRVLLPLLPLLLLQPGGVASCQLDHPWRSPSRSTARTLTST